MRTSIPRGYPSASPLAMRAELAWTLARVLLGGVTDLGGTRALVTGVAVGRKVDGQEIVDDVANVSGDPLASSRPGPSASITIVLCRPERSCGTGAPSPICKHSDQSGRSRAR